MTHFMLYPFTHTQGRRRTDANPAPKPLSPHTALIGRGIRTVAK